MRGRRDTQLDDILCESTIHGDAVRVKALAKELVPASAEKTVSALWRDHIKASVSTAGGDERGRDAYGLADVRDAPIALLKSLDVPAVVDDDSDGFVAGDELRQKDVRESCASNKWYGEGICEVKTVGSQGTWQ